MPKIVQVSGSTGFVGQNLSGYLQGCPEISVVGISTKERLAENITIPDATDSIVHLAGKAHDLKRVPQPDEYFQANFELTRKLYDAFLKSKARKFIFISSVKAAADSIEGALTEDVIADPKSYYGKSKRMAEQYIQSQPLPAGKSYYILRPCMIHGPGNKGNLNLLYQFVARRIPYPLAAFENRRSFLSVENLCFIIKEIIEREDFPGGIYHLADDEALSTKDLIVLLSQALEKTPRLWQIPVSMINAFAKIGDLVHLPLTTERLQKLTENYVVSNQKVKTALKKNLPLSAREGIIITAYAFKKPGPFF